MKPGICFICNEVCPIEAYCHFECSLAYSDFKTKELKEKIQKEKEGKKVNWKESTL